jgi:nitroreductase
MALIDVIEHRRSTRLYLDRQVEREKINKCLQAARLAPSAVNTQPWKYVVVDDRHIRDRLVKAAFRGVFSFNQWSAEVPVFIVAVIDAHDLMSRAIVLRDALRPMVDIGIATEHLVLQADELGLGTCWMGGFDEKGVKSTLNIPRNKKVAAIIALGYPDSQEVKRKQERRELEEMSSFNSW